MPIPGIKFNMITYCRAMDKLWQNYPARAPFPDPLLSWCCKANMEPKLMPGWGWLRDNIYRWGRVLYSPIEHLNIPPSFTAR